MPLNQTNGNKIWANSELAVFMFASFLKKAKITGDLAISLRYSFTFRDYDPMSLAVLAYTCEEQGNI